MPECSEKASCIFGSKNEAEARAFIALVVSQTLDGVGLGGPDAKENITEIRAILSSWHQAKRMATGGFWLFIKWFGMWMAKITATAFFIYLLVRFGGDENKIKTISNIWGRTP